MKVLLVLAAALIAGAGATTIALSNTPGAPYVATISSAGAVSTPSSITAPITLAPTPAPTGDPSTNEGGPGITAAPTPSNEAGWVTTLPAGFAPVMPAATAELATTLVTPSLASLHLSTSPPPYWTLSECDWLSDTMYADIQLDSNAVHWYSLVGWWYAGEVDNWRFLEGIATQACWRGGVITGEQAATAITDAMNDGWNGHPAHLSQDAPGSSEIPWDRQWTDAYQEIATLFAEVPQAPAYYCLEVWGEGDAACASTTAASVLSSLGVTP